MKCNCNKNCIIPKNEVLVNIEDIYLPCPKCNKSKLKKSIPIKRQIKLDEIDKNYKRCPSCKKRHIDIVMAHILKIMIINNQISPSSSIRKVGTPLITPAKALKSSPYLFKNSLVILTTHINKKVAEEIYSEVPEVKGVIYGDINSTVGQLNESIDINQYELLSGCDIRCDIQETPEGMILIYKPQSKIHIEFAKENSPKINEVDLILDEYSNPTVIDAMCGPGTLGIYALKKNAKKVLFNDIYDLAIDSTNLNLKINDISSDKYEIIHEDVNNLANIITEKYDVGLIDAFPEIDVEKYKESLEKICSKVFII